MGIQNYEYRTGGNTEQMGTRNGWEYGTDGNTEWVEISVAAAEPDTDLACTAMALSAIVKPS
jgi:hypothetical protein